MSATLARPQRTPAPRRVATTPAVTRRRSPARPAMDAHETQAVLAATRFVRGERDVGRRLTPAPAAPVQFLESGGVPLSPGLRAELETGFDADLAAVRVHHDAAAARAARNADARAFAAGRDIFFAEGAFSPVTRAGRELIAHEVAHVLQQTGRPGPEGRLRATRVSGFGDVQYAPGPGAVYQTTYGVTFQTLKDRHTDGNGDPALARFIARIEAALGGSLDGTTQAAADLEAAVLKNDKAYVKAPASSRSFLLDCLKLLDRFDGATHLLNLDPTLTSWAYMAEMPGYMVERFGYGWFAKVVAAHPILKRFWPRAFFETYRTYLFGPTRDIQSLQVPGLGTLAEAFKTFYEAWEQLKVPADNELVIEAFTIIGQLDELRRKELARYAADANRVFGGISAATLPIRGRRAVAHRLSYWAASLVEKGQPAEIFQVFGTELMKVARDASTFWDGILAFVDVMGMGATALDATSLGDASQAVVRKDKTLATSLPVKLAVAARTLFTLAGTGDTADLPSDTVYAAQRNAARDALFLFAQKEIELPLIDIIRKAKEPDVAVAYGSLLLWLHDFIAFLDTYKVEDDRAYQAANAGQPDVRVAHRIRAAKAIERLATAVVSGKGGALARWQDLLAIAVSVTTGAQERRSRLALLSDWEVETTAPIAQIADDFAEFSTEWYAALGGLTPRQLAILLISLYYEDLSGTINRLLTQAPQSEDLNTPEGAKEALRRKPLLSQAFEETQARRPQRYVVKDFEFAEFKEPQQIPGIEGVVPPNEVASVLVLSHPKTKALLAAQKVPSEAEALFPVDKQARPEIFIWILPKFARVVEALRSDRAGLNEVIATPELPLAEVKRLPNEKWFPALLLAGGASKAIEKFVTTRLEEEEKRLTVAVRAAVSHERRQLAERITKALGLVTGRADETSGIPLDVLDAINAFGRWVIPREDEFAQPAALMLAIAPVLADALEYERRFDIITGYYGLIVLALGFTAGDRQKQLDPITNEAERRAIPTARTKLEELRTHFNAVRTKVQTRFGFKSDDGQVLMSLIYGYPITPDPQGFWIDGVKYELVKVHRKFTYHPAYGIKPLPGSPEGAEGYAPPLLTVDGTTYDVEAQPPINLLDIRINGQLGTVTSKDDVLLKQLSYVVEMRAFSISMEKTAELIEDAVSIGLDIAEFIPGVGQGIAAARIIANIVQFVASGEFDEIMAAVRGDPVAAIMEIVSHVEDLFQPDELWIFLLFGSPLLDRLRTTKPSDASQRTRKRSRKRGKGTPLTRIIAQISNIRRGFASSMDLLSNRVQGPVRGFQVAILSRPRLAFGIGLVADNLYRLEAITGASVKQILSGITEEQATVKEQLERVLGGLATLQLPEKVVPTQALIAALIDFILGRFGTKGKAARLILNAVPGAMDEVSGLIADGLAAVGVDPNDAWKEIKGSIEATFGEAHAALVDGLYEVFNGPPLELGLKRPARTTVIDLALAGDGFPPDEEESIAPAVEPYGLTDAGAPLALPPPPSGRPLPAPVRAAAELRFGHDFGHVRLHTGAEAAPATGPVGAEGLATGSHVYLRPGLSPEGGTGQRILDHELTHVLQQTGPRPLGGSHDARPAIGQPGRGLVLNRAREAAANRTAAEVHDRVAGAPIDVGGGDVGGIQPAVLSIETIQRLLNELTSEEKAKDAAKEIDRLAYGKSAADVPDGEKTIALAIWNEVAAQVEAIKEAELPQSPHLRSVHELFVRHFSGQVGFVRKAVPYIASGVLENEKATAGTKKTKQASKPKRVIDTGRFASSLRSYVMALTGVVLVFGVRDRPENGSTPASGWVKGNVEVTNLLLDNVGGGSELWTKAFANAKVKPEEAEDLRPLVRAALRQAGVGPFVSGSDDQGNPDLIRIWDTTTYAFHRDLIAYVRRQKEAAGAVLPTQVPPWTAYAKHDDKAGGPIVGVRIGVYGDNAQWGPGRESHHTTQYLLIEYFQHETTGRHPFNAKARDAWRSLGVQWTGDTPSSLQAPGHDPVQFTALDSGERGNAMPAILLSRTTHRSGNLHVKGEPPDDWVASSASKKPTSTQGTSVDNVFRRHVYTGVLSQLGNAGAQEFTDAINALPPDQLSAARTTLYNAVQASYRWMHGQMIPALRDALPSLELGYYELIEREVAKAPTEQQAKQHDARADILEKVAKVAEKNNDDVMAGYGWKT
ncbi:MAG TPA: DUF4157 domain-containing protein [Thermomicrobiales bacterium]|nr:DUF4157 domain-containing protein [Thermomicrobiales bacterium]